MTMTTDHDAKMQAQRALADRLADLCGHPAPGDIYEHNKGGLYAVIMVGIDEDLLTPRVGYFSQTHQTYSYRTLDNWLSLVTGRDGAVRPRFVLAEPGRP
jgi:hypothetical protein